LIKQYSLGLIQHFFAFLSSASAYQPKLDLEKQKKIYIASLCDFAFAFAFASSFYL